METGPPHGIEELVNAAETASPATMSGEVSRSTDNTVIITWTSFL